MPTNRPNTRQNAYRTRLRAAGYEEVLVQLPTEWIERLDAMKERREVRNRSQAVLQLMERGSQTDNRMS
jgi:metal-responsive CopG/Arc/MetJ family transcriptional regulator